MANLIHKNDDAQSEFDPFHNYMDGIFLRSETTASENCTMCNESGVRMVVWGDRVFNCHPIPAINPDTGCHIFDGSIVAYGIRFELSEYEISQRD